MQILSQQHSAMYQLVASKDRLSPAASVQPYMLRNLQLGRPRCNSESSDHCRGSPLETTCRKLSPPAQVNKIERGGKVVAVYSNWVILRQFSSSMCMLASFTAVVLLNYKA